MRLCLLTVILPGLFLLQAPGGETISRDGEVIAVSQGDQPDRRAHHLETSLDLLEWREVAFSNTSFDRYLLRKSDRSRFYRLRSKPEDGLADWTNQLALGDQRIFSEPRAGVAEPVFAKFTIDLVEDPDRVYFQDSDRYPFHFDFARARMPRLRDVSFPEYIRISLFPEGQELVVGTVILPPNPDLSELAIQVTGNEPFPREDVARWFRATRSRVVAPDGWRFFYLPAFEQSDVAFENRAWFAERGILVDTAARWISESACYSEGWALGRFRFVPAREIDAAYGDGRLTHEDILVTDQVPAEIPVVAGVIALSPATPNSHVAILSRSFGIPFAFASGDALQEQVRSNDGEDVLFVASVGDGACSVRIQNVEGKLTSEERQAILETKKPPPVQIAPIRRADRFHLYVDELTPEAIDLAGGKAANFGFLRRAIPGHSPSPAVALTFDLWSDFMGKSWEGMTLGESIARDLSEFAFPPDVARLRPVLEDIRRRIREQAEFSSAAKGAIFEALEVFDEPRKRIRFRSSTNVEDSGVLSGAGLYDSFSGCVEDDRDGDNVGPSHCNPDKANERGAFRAIRRVYASFYNENAFIERLRHGVEEGDAGMAVLAHYSFPDETELANGVATLEIRKGGEGERVISMEIVSQTGANSITNPDNSSAPEVVTAHYETATTDAEYQLEQRSSLLAEGTVLDWTGEYGELTRLLDTAAQAYEAFFDGEQILDLDFEWKKIAPGNLVVKQIRRIPKVPLVPPPVIP